MYKVYCDFDATVTVNDVWHRLFTEYGKPLAFEIWKEFSAGRKTAAECIAIACSTVEGAPKDDVIRMFEAEPLRPGFIEFVEFCRDQSVDLRIISDGFTAYIRPILAANGLDLPYHTNEIELTDEGTLSVSFPYGRESCRMCGCCKCGQLLTTSEDLDTVVYVGDGYSDVCPVRMSDVVFARDTLLSFCSQNGIPHHPFDDFFTVRTILEKHLKERPKYKRDQAKKRRKELYSIE